MKRSVIIVIIIVTLIIGSAVPALASGTGPATALNGHWAEAALVKAEQNRLLNTADIDRPDEPLTRAGFADMLVRAYGAFVKADLSAYADIEAGTDAAVIMAKAVGMGAFKGSGGTLLPDALMTREEAFVALTRVLRLGAPDDSALQKFSDSAQISSWARIAAASLTYTGYVNGCGGQLRPLSPITRAEAAQLFDNLFKTYLSAPGTYTSVPEGNVMINVPGVILKGATVKGMVVVGDGVGNGNCAIEDVRMTSILMVRGGGPHTVVAGQAAAEGENNAVTLLPDADGGVGQILVSNAGGTTVLNSPNFLTHVSSPFNPPAPPTLVSFSGGIISGMYGSVIDSRPPQPPPMTPPQEIVPSFQPAQPPSPQQPLNLQDATVNQLTLQGSSATVNVTNSMVDTLTVTPGAGGASITVGTGGAVTQINADAPANISGSGTVGNVIANSNDIMVLTRGTYVVAGAGYDRVIAGDQPVPPGTSTSTPPSSPPPPPPPPSNNADLISLSVNGDLIPDFSAEETDYYLELSAAASVEVTAHSSAAQAIRINGEPAAENVAATVSVVYGDNTIVVMVKAADGSEKAYRIHITIAAGPVSGSVSYDEESNGLKITVTMNIQVAYCESADSFSVSADGSGVNIISVTADTNTITILVPTAPLPETFTVIYDPDGPNVLHYSGDRVLGGFSIDLEVPAG